MSSVFVPGLQALSHCTVSRTRELPVVGDILVREGDRVGAADKVARASLIGDMLIMRLPEQLGIEPQEAMRGLAVSEGDEVEQDTLICQHAGFFGLFTSRYLSPARGTIEFIAARTGHVGLRLSPREVSLHAYLSGQVTEVEEGRSVTIAVTATYVQGIFGVGGERWGRLQRIDCAADTELEARHIPKRCDGAILFGGMCPTSDALRAAAAAGARGLLVGSLDDRGLAGFLGYDIGIALTGDEDIPLTIIMTEGFGRLPLSDRVYQLLDAREGSEASINGATQVRAGAVRPEVIIPYTEEYLSQQHTVQQYTVQQPPSLTLKIGARIRLIRVPYFGKEAEVTDLPHTPARLETGTHTRVLRARLASGEEVTVPRANVELIE